MPFAHRCAGAALIRPTVPTWLLIVVATAYVLAPGAPGLPLSGIPIGQTGIVTLVALIGTGIWTGRAANRVAAKWVVVVAVAVGLKIALAAMTPQIGWLGRYYANENFAAPMQPSMDFRGLEATRIDRRLSMRETEFPVHFYNDREYNTGVFREWTLPFSIHWTGYVTAERDQPVAFQLSANGRAELIVDGARQAQAAGSPGQTAIANASLILTPGSHRLEVRYQKPANTAGLLRLDETTGTVTDLVSPFNAPSPSAAMLRLAGAVGWLLHLIAIGGAAAALWPGVRAQQGEKLVPAFVVGFLVAQGLWKSRHLVGHVWTLSGGDDWLNYEMSARDVVLHGVMMSQGGVIGRGQPFSLYPGYAYFVALVHGITGESLAGVVLMNFVLLAFATVIVYQIARRLFGPIRALGGLAWLMLIEQADFVRYYTVTLFSENLYVVLVAATVWLLMQHHASGRRRDLVAAGVCGALASWTRPSMMLLLPFAVAGIAYARGRAGGARQASLDAIVFVTAWMAAIAPITIRNYLMSGRAVLISSGQGATFIAYNLPIDDKLYFNGFDGTLFNAAAILIRMFLDHPIISLANYGRKLGFSLGMVHWLGGAGTVHPELILTSLGYFAAVIFLKEMRSIAAWPIHAFTMTHIATLMLTMPSNYGYRMILPPFMFMAVAAGAVAVTPLMRFAVSRWPALGNGAGRA